MTTDTSTVNLAITSGTGSSGAHARPAARRPRPLASSPSPAAPINKIGTDYTLTATDVETGGTLTATSATFNVTLGAAGTAGLHHITRARPAAPPSERSPWSRSRTPGGNVITTGTGVRPTRSQLPSTPGRRAPALACTQHHGPSDCSGVATFAGCKITLGTRRVRSPSRQPTTRATLPTGISAPFTVAGGATKLVFATSADEHRPAAPRSRRRRSSGSRTRPATSSPTRPTGHPGHQDGQRDRSAAAPAAVTAVRRIATFAGCKITLGTAGLLHAEGHQRPRPHGAPVTPSPSLAPASKLVFTTQPTSSTGGVAFPTAARGHRRGLLGRRGDHQHLRRDPGHHQRAPGTRVPRSSCTDPGHATAGVATFSGAPSTWPAPDTRCTPPTAALTAANSSSINITRRSAPPAGFTTQPGGGANGGAWTNQPAVTVEDAGGNPVTTATNAVSLTIGTPARDRRRSDCTDQPCERDRRRGHVLRLPDRRHDRAPTR